MKKSLLLLPLVAMSLAGCEPPIEELGDLLDIEVASGLKQEYVQYTIVELDEISVTATFEKRQSPLKEAIYHSIPKRLIHQRSANPK